MAGKQGHLQFANFQLNLAIHIRTTTVVVHRLATAAHWFARGAIAQVATAPGLLQLLACDPDYYVRRALARNMNTPVDVLRQLLRDEDGFVRWESQQTYAAQTAKQQRSAKMER